MKGTKQMAPLVAVFFLLITANIFAAESVISIRKATPGQMHVAFLGRSINVALVVRMEKEKNEEKNWELNVDCDGIDGGIYTGTGKSFWNGEKQSEIYDFGFNLPSATYRCEAVLERKQKDGKMKKFTSSVEVTVH